MVNLPPLIYLLATLYVNSEQSPTVALGTAGDTAHLRGCGQMCRLQKEAKMEGLKGEGKCLICGVKILQSDYIRRYFFVRTNETKKHEPNLMSNVLQN